LGRWLLGNGTEESMAVGLSFGSPTSGTGFDVSSTVASIVSNLKNVETPWNNQLTSLKAQDTAISSLGTIMSTLSNDLSSLTDFTGVMSIKTGSSSNTNVLSLTSATSSAVAGTHTVEVKNLAASASGYMDAVKSSSDTLKGSIVIQAASGAAQTITLDSTNNTLTGLAKSINSSGVGVTASVLTDSSGARLSIVSSTSGANGQISVSSSIVDSTTSSATLNFNSKVTGVDASLTVDGVDMTSSSNTVTNLISGLTFQLASPSAENSDGTYTPVQVVIGNDVDGAGSAIATFVKDYNSLISAINTQDGYDSSGVAEPLFGSSSLSLLQQQLMNGLTTQNPSGTMDSIATNLDTTLSGSITLKVGTGAAQTISLTSSDNTLDGLASAINSANLGVTAKVSTSGTTATLDLVSQVSGSKGALTVTSNLTATSDTLLKYSGAAGSSSVTSNGVLTKVNNSGDSLTGTMTVKVGTGSAQTIAVNSGETLTGLADSINNAGIGVTASVVYGTGTDTSAQLKLVSNTTGTAGTLTVTSSLLDTSNQSTASVGYYASSDISNLSSLGLAVSADYDGTLSLDSATLYSALNSDFSAVTGFFQNADSWGSKFNTTLTNSGTASTKGLLYLAKSSNSSIESTLNANISREESIISSEQISLTAELNSANEILQSIPTQLKSINEIYAAITGYSSSS
jgi:flagellar hook-associated protein 2